MDNFGTELRWLSHGWLYLLFQKVLKSSIDEVYGRNEMSL